MFKKIPLPFKKTRYKKCPLLLGMEMGSKQLKNENKQKSQIDPDYPEGRYLSHAYYIHVVPLP